MGGIIQKAKNLSRLLRYLRFELPGQMAGLIQENSRLKSDVEQLQGQLSQLAACVTDKVGSIEQSIGNQSETLTKLVSAQTDTLFQHIDNKAAVATRSLDSHNRAIADCIADKATTIGNSIDDQTRTIAECITGKTAELSRQIEHGISAAQDSAALTDFWNPELNSLLLHREEARKRVLIIGFYGGYNLGDEMMLQTLLAYLKDRNALRVTVMLSENSWYRASDLGDVDVLHYSRTCSDYSHLASAFDALIIGGGALLDDKPWLSMYRHFISLATTVVELPAYFSARGKPAIALGLSTNSQLNNADYISICSQSIREMRYFSVRDPYSLETLRSCGIPTEKVHLIDDLVLADPAWLDQPSNEPASAQRIAITWVHFPKLQPLLVNCIETIHALRPDAEIGLIPMYEYQHVDSEYYQQAIEQLSPGASLKTHVAAYPGNLRKAIELFNQVDAAINIRYHAALICGALGIPQTVVELKDHPHYKNKMSWIRDTFSRTASLVDSQATAEVIAASTIQKLETARGERISETRINENIKTIKAVLDEL